MASPEADPVIAIVGAGFSGTLLASQLLRQAQRPLRLFLIERSGRFGPGVAYGTDDPGHLLNVSAGAMSAWPEDPSHLLRWLDLNRSALADLLPACVDASSFLPRRIYGLYLESILEQAEGLATERCTLQRIVADLIDLEPLDGDGPQSPRSRGYRLHLDGHAPLHADQVVLAWGNSAVRPPQQRSQAIRHGWASDATTDLDPKASVALLGTGLTMVDMVVSLHRQGHRGPIVAMSRHGYRPNAHRYGEPLGDWLDAEQAPATVLELWRLIRERVAWAIRQGQDWRAVIDGLRPRTQELWRRLDLNERRRVLRHAAVVWDVHRHRIAPALDALLQELLTSSRLTILAARLLSHDVEDTGLRLTIRRRGTNDREAHRVDRLIICTGIALDYASGADTLVSRLRERGLLLSDPLGLGAQCDPGGGLLDARGLVRPDLHTLGPPRKGQLWESIAVPELRLQARDLAQRLLDSLPRYLQGLPPLAPAAPAATAAGELVLRQLFDAPTCTYTYLIADPASGDAALVDPVLEQLDRDLALLEDLGLRLTVCLETHLHADHITAAGQLRRRTGCRLVVPAAAGIRGADQLLRGNERLPLGSLLIGAIATPGHTPEHMAYRIGDSYLFSGDALLIRGCGRTDFQNGDPAQLYDSLQRLLSLPAAMRVYPGHDEQGRSHTTIGEERRLNPKLAGRSREAFIQLMQQQQLDPPMRIAEALPANLHLGDLQPAQQHNQERQDRLLQSEQAQATEEANREIYNAFLGMFI
jgi:uncharacterized NAD(P)/FAD-binding protein YdhS/glyoxylase-like metal-dependent hydrolase (beta-lactamase superfamily II)